MHYQVQCTDQNWSQHSFNSWVILSSEFSPSIFVITVFSKSSKSISPFEICFYTCSLHIISACSFKIAYYYFYFFSMSFCSGSLETYFLPKLLKWKSDKNNMIHWKTLLSYNVWNILENVSKVHAFWITLVFACSWLSVIHQMDYIFYL